MRPRKIETIADLEAFIAEAKRKGLLSDAKVLMAAFEIDGLDHPTMVFYPPDGPDAPAFIGIQYWTDDDLAANAAHNDQLERE